MLKKALIILFLFSSSVFSMEKIDSKYCIQYGNPKAPIQIIEYFSFTCPSCMKIINKDFEKIKEDYLSEDGDIFWIFHPYPQDIFTIQTMLTFENLNEFDKIVLMEALCKTIKDTRKLPTESWTKHLNNYNKGLGLPVHDYNNMDYLSTTKAFRAAFNFLTQDGVIKEVPTVEVNGVIFDRMPTRDFIDNKIKELRSIRSKA